MKRLVAVSAAVAACTTGSGAVPAAMAAVPAAGTWSRAIEVPGLGALNKGGIAVVESVSCASAGNCAAGGFYRDGHGHRQGFVAARRNGHWGTATRVPGLGALNTGGDAVILSVSCGSAGNCAAGGFYRNRHGQQGFVATENNGVWGTTTGVPGLAALNTGGNAGVNSVSCASPGNCAAGGFYRDRHGQQGFVAAERNGRWGRAARVPGLAALNTGGDAVVNSVSCGSAGSCAAGGFYRDRHGHRQGFVAGERNGRWATATGVPGLAALATGGHSVVNSVSCASPGDCAAGGPYADRDGNAQGFVASENNGVWGTATGVPGLAALNTGGDAGVNSVSCASPGNCAVGGPYADRPGSQQGYVADERNGVWGTATGVPGLAALNEGGFVQVLSVSCGSAGNCAAGGDYTRRNDSLQGFVADEQNGVWGTATGVPGLAALNTGGAAVVVSVSCASAGNCAAGGEYADRHDKGQGFVAEELHGR